MVFNKKRIQNKKKQENKAALISLFIFLKGPLARCCWILKELKWG
uniref:Uncharacterized protein n=1 Tax=Rhizophora mucronata TaxID=61149 RepID=A0A2P2N9A8_RHIMU